MPRKTNSSSPASDDGVAGVAATAQRVKRLAEAAASQQETKAGESPAAERFRSWVTDRVTGYERLTDEQARLIVVKFHDRPPQELLDKLKEAGFRYQPEYFGQAKVWTRRNDFEGREQVKAIEAALRGPTPERA